MSIYIYTQLYLIILFICYEYIIIIICITSITTHYFILHHRITESAHNLTINDLLLSLDNKAPCFLVLLDLYSTFDTLNYDILALRLNEIGIHGIYTADYVLLFLEILFSAN